MSEVTLSAPATAGEVAAQLRAATRAAFRAETAARQRDPHRFSISGLGGCTRAAAYALAHTPVSDDPEPEEGRAANLGTWQHAGLLPRLAEQLGNASVEVPVTLAAAGIELSGHIDLDWHPVGAVDLKTVGEHRLGRVRRSGDPYYPHRVQASGYALARLQAGRAGSWVGWHYLDRASGDEEIIVQPFTNSTALEVIDRVQELVDYAEEPDMAPRDERGPGLSFACDRCPWLRRCWGDDAEPGVTGAQANLVRNDQDVIAALTHYQDARDREGQGRRDKEDAEALLDRTRFDTYGPVPDRPGVGIRYGRDRGHEVLDQKAARERLVELGEEPPMKPRRGNLRIKLVSIDDGGGQP